MANEPTTYLHDGIELPIEDWSQNVHSFEDLTKIIQDTHDAAQTTNTNTASTTISPTNKRILLRCFLAAAFLEPFLPLLFLPLLFFGELLLPILLSSYSFVNKHFC